MSKVYSASHRAPAQYPADPVLRERDQRLESLKGVIGKLAHDFNNFLVPLLGYVTLIREETPGESPAHQYAATMESAARKTEGFLDSILLAVRPQRRFAPKEIDFGAVVRAAIERFQQSLPPTAQISVRSSIASPHLFADETQWRNALDQLLGNARFALATGGNLTVTLTAAMISADESARLNIFSGEAVKLTVEDNGFGMNAETLRRACEPFFTTRVGNHAPGLGLTIAHSVTLLHGGQLEIQSAEDAGTTVAIWLPIFTGSDTTHLSASRAGIAPKKPLPLGRSRILLVEDDPLVREVVKACLQRFRKEVHVAVDGEEGLRVFKRYPQDWALIVSDITMPKMNGIELYRAIRELDPEMRMILVSGDADGKYHDAFATDSSRPLLLKKPFTLKSFADVVKEHVQ